jgi:hemerythrin HHE cation binding domain-containing protein
MAPPTEPPSAAAPFASPVRGGVGGRSAALAPLSRDHQHTLALALELRRASDEIAGEAWERFLTFWRAEGARHFAEEDSVLLPAYARVGDATHPAVVRTRGVGPIDQGSVASSLSHAAM